MPTDGTSSPTKTVDDVCHSTNDDDNNTNVLDNLDEAELSTVDKSVNNDEVRLDIGEESATNDGNDRDTSYQEVIAVDDIDNNTSVEQQRVGGQDEDNSTVQINNVVGGESQAQVADEQRITSTPCGTSIIDDESAQSSSQTVTEGNDGGNDQSVTVEDAKTEFNQMMNMIQNNKDGNAKLAGIMENFLLRLIDLSEENADMKKMVQQKLQSLEDHLLRCENDIGGLKKNQGKHSKAIKVNKKKCSMLRVLFNELKEQVDDMQEDVDELKSRFTFSGEQSAALSAALTESNGKWSDKMYPAFISKLEDSGIETAGLTAERVRTHCRSTSANPTFVRYAELDMTSKMIPIDMLFGPNGIWNGSGNISWKKSCAATPHINPQDLKNRFRAVKNAINKIHKRLRSLETIAKVVNRELLLELPCDAAMTLVRNAFPDMEFPAQDETSGESVTSSTASDTMKSATASTATTSSSTGGDTFSLELSSTTTHEMAGDLSSPRLPISATSEHESFLMSGPAESIKTRAGDLSSPRGLTNTTPRGLTNSTITIPTPKVNNKSSSRNNNSTSEGNAVCPSGDTTSSSSTLLPVVEERTSSSEVPSVETQLVVAEAAAMDDSSGDTPRSSATDDSFAFRPPSLTTSLAPVIEEKEANTLTAATTATSTIDVFREQLYRDFDFGSLGTPPINGPSPKQFKEIKALLNSDDFAKQQTGINLLQWYLSAGVENWTAKNSILKGISKLPLLEILIGDKSSLTKVATKLVANMAYEFSCGGEKNSQYLNLYKQVFEPLVSACLDLVNKRESSFVLQVHEFISSLLSSEYLCCEYVWFASLLAGKIKTSMSDITKALCLYTLMIVVRTRRINYSTEVLRHDSNNNWEKESLLQQIMDVCKVGLISFGRWYNGWTSRAGNSELRETYVNAHYKLVLALHTLFPDKMNDVVRGIENGRSTTKKKEFEKVKVAELAEWGEGGSMRSKFGSLSPHEMPSRR